APDASRARAISRSWSSRVALLRWSRARVGTPRARAASSPAADGSLLITSATRASRSPASMRSRIATRLEPRPEIRTPIRFPEGVRSGMWASSEEAAEEIEPGRHDARQERQAEVDGGPLDPAAHRLPQGRAEQDHGARREQEAHDREIPHVELHASLPRRGPGAGAGRLAPPRVDHVPVPPDDLADPEVLLAAPLEV